MANKAYFVSDIHLENMQERNGQHLLRFLHSIADDPATVDLFLLGDIFDFWLSKHQVFVKKFEPLYEPLLKLKAKGGKLVYVEGNHDLHLHGFWEKKLGFEIYTEAEYMKVGAYTVRIEHGDLMNPNDKDYLKWRSIIRNPFVIPLGHILPGKFWSKVGEKLSAKSRQHSRVYRADKEDNIRQLIRDHGKKAFIERPFDIIISGHMHVRLDEVFEVNGNSYRNINLGTWVLEENPQVLLIEDAKVSWIKL